MEDEHHHHHSSSPHLSHAETTTSTAIMSNYNVNVQFDPATPQAGKPTSLRLVVTEQKVGEPIKQFDILHDKLMHLIIVNSEDLSHFAHIHPELDKETGIFHIAHTFSKAGKYKMWIDTKPKGGIQILTAFAFNVEGQPVQAHPCKKCGCRGTKLRSHPELSARAACGWQGCQNDFRDQRCKWKAYPQFRALNGSWRTLCYN